MLITALMLTSSQFKINKTVLMPQITSYYVANISKSFGIESLHFVNAKLTIVVWVAILNPNIEVRI